jgi:putative RNA 2'-phosphotransferase
MSGADVRVSRTLSFWLRHRPDAAGLQLDAAGWADTAAVLHSLAREGLALDRAGLQRLVAANDKQRFELSEDGARIRARQGHSIDVQGDWVRATPPDTLFHGTVERFMPAILAEGLKPMGRHHVHLSPDEATARRVAARRGSPVVLAVAAGRLAAAGQPFWLSSNGVWLTDRVAPEALRRT